MRKFGVLVGIGIVMTLLFGLARSAALYEESQAALVTKDGNIEPLR